MIELQSLYQHTPDLSSTSTAGSYPTSNPLPNDYVLFHSSMDNSDSAVDLDLFIHLAGGCGKSLF